ncbi:MAG: membrane protein insertase YidC [Treponema sp.]|nr:membrane protein insertase YidC [Treponema sp.]
MERNTILAVVLSSIVLIASFLIQGYFATQRQQALSVQIQEPQVTAAETEPQLQETSPAFQAAPALQSAPEQQSAFAETPVQMVPPESIEQLSQLQGNNVPLEYVTIDTELFTAVLTNAGGDMVSFKWKDARNNTYVDLILSGDNEARAFSVAFGDHNAQPITSNFHVRKLSNYSVEFYHDFFSPNANYGTDGRFTLRKRYEFIPNEYMFRLTVFLEGGFSVPGFNFAGNAYTLSFGPQIGPQFVKLDNIYDYRHYDIFTNGRRRTVKVNDVIDSRPSWAAITGKYFAFMVRPLIAQYSIIYSDKAEAGLVSASRLNIVRPAVNVSQMEDVYQFYLGPKTQEILANYNTGRNEFGIRDASLNEVASSRGFWGIFSPLEKLLKWLLLLFYGIVQNYGIAIILLTLLIKILFFPLTKKGSEATLRMQALAPRIKEIQDKYKNNPQKLRAEMGNFYQQEGYNPVSGCLPMLLQLPIFIAMYNLFNNHFDLRGAGFIPGWIPDLSVPEYIVQFQDFRVPIFGWTALRVLPFIYVGSQLLYGKVTQMPGQQSNNQMKMMLYVMPIVFFFILYDVPSGLLIYWIFSNLLTLAQQLVINKYVIKKKAALEKAQAEQEPKIAPGKKKKKNF